VGLPILQFKKEGLQYISDGSGSKFFDPDRVRSNFYCSGWVRSGQPSIDGIFVSFFESDYGDWFFIHCGVIGWTASWRQFIWLVKSIVLSIPLYYFNDSEWSSITFLRVVYINSATKHWSLLTSLVSHLLVSSFLTCYNLLFFTFLSHEIVLDNLGPWIKLYVTYFLGYFKTIIK